MKGHKLFIFLLSGTLAAANASAAYTSFPSEIVNLLIKAFNFLIKLLQNQNVRNGLSLILLAAILYNVYASAIRMIKVLSGSAGLIAAPLSGMSVLAIYWKIRPEIISTLFFWLAGILVIIYIIKGFMRLGNFFKGGFNPKRAGKEQNRVKKAEKENIKQDDTLHEEIGDVNKELKEEKYDSEEIKKLLEKTGASSKELEDLIKKIHSDTKKG